METEQDWRLSFTLLSELVIRPKRVFVRAAGIRCSAKWDSTASCFVANVRGSRYTLEETDLAVVAGEGETATLLPIEIEEPDASNGLGSTTLRSAQWDMDRLRIDAGAVLLREPLHLGSLIADSPAQVTRAFDIRWEGARRAVSQTVYLDEGESRIELATFLPTTYWTAEAVESSLSQPVPEWSATAAVGEDIQLPPDPSTGIRVFVSPQLMAKIDRVSVLPLPAHGRPIVSVDELQATDLARAVRMTGFGGPHTSGAGTKPVPLMPLLVEAGTYTVVAWRTAEEDGKIELHSCAPTVVSEGFVRVQLD